MSPGLNCIFEVGTKIYNKNLHKNICLPFAHWPYVMNRELATQKKTVSSTSIKRNTSFEWATITTTVLSTLISFGFLGKSDARRSLLVFFCQWRLSQRAATPSIFVTLDFEWNARPHANRKPIRLPNTIHNIYRALRKALEWSLKIFLHSIICVVSCYGKMRVATPHRSWYCAPRISKRTSKATDSTNGFRAGDGLRLRTSLLRACKCAHWFLRWSLRHGMA